MYTDVAMTVPYVSGAPASTVYVLPDITALGNTTFDINVSTTITNGCVITKTINVINKSKVWNGSASADWGNANNWSSDRNSRCKCLYHNSKYSSKAYCFRYCKWKKHINYGIGRISSKLGHTLTINDAIEVKSTGKFTFENNAEFDTSQRKSKYQFGSLFFTREIPQICLRYSYTYWSSPSTQMNRR